MSSAVRRRVVTLIVLVSAWLGGTACFPFFSMRNAERSKELAGGGVDEEIDRGSARLYITSVEDRPAGRRFRLLLTGYLADRPADSGLVFQYDEGTQEVVRITERSALERPVKITGRAVTLLRYPYVDSRQLDGLDEQLRIDDQGWPRNLLIIPEFNRGHIAMRFRYRTGRQIVQEGRLELVPRHLHNHPALAQINKLNYLWTVPVDAVVVVGGWSTFLIWGPIVLGSQ